MLLFPFQRAALGREGLLSSGTGAGVASPLVPAARYFQPHPAPWEVSLSVPLRGKLCPEHLVLPGAPADMSPLGHGSQGSWKRRSPTVPHPGTADVAPFLGSHIAAPTSPSGNGALQGRQSRGMPGKRDLRLQAPCQALSRISAAPGLGCCLLTSAPHRNLRRGTRPPRVTQHRARRGKRRQERGERGCDPWGRASVPAGVSLPSSRHRRQNPQGNEALNTPGLGGSFVGCPPHSPAPTSPGQG